jgi:pre-rRNA-processing protein TSR4
LNYLNFDEEINLDAGLLDWGTLAIYTCQDSCDSGTAYKKEFLWKQDVLS